MLVRFSDWVERYIFMEKSITAHVTSLNDFGFTLIEMVAVLLLGLGSLDPYIWWQI